MEWTGTRKDHEWNGNIPSPLYNGRAQCKVSISKAILGNPKPEWGLLGKLVVATAE